MKPSVIPVPQSLCENAFQHISAPVCRAVASKPPETQTGDWSRLKDNLKISRMSPLQTVGLDSYIYSINHLICPSLSFKFKWQNIPGPKYVQSGARCPLTGNVALYRKIWGNHFRPNFGLELTLKPL